MIKITTRAAYERDLADAVRTGAHLERFRVVRFLRAQAHEHRGRVGDARRRGALQHAADRIEQGRKVGRP